MYISYVYSVIAEDLQKILIKKKQLLEEGINNRPVFFTEIYLKRILTF